MTLKALAASAQPSSRAAAALVEGGYADSTRLDELTPGSVIRTLVEVLARELAELHDRLEETYESAFHRDQDPRKPRGPGRWALPTAAVVVVASAAGLTSNFFIARSYFAVRGLLLEAG